MSRAGNFLIHVSQPYPAWCELTFLVSGREVTMRFHHKELADLKYAVEKAMQEAREVLGKDHRWEVGT